LNAKRNAKKCSTSGLPDLAGAGNQANRIAEFKADITSDRYGSSVTLTGIVRIAREYFSIGNFKECVYEFELPSRDNVKAFLDDLYLEIKSDLLDELTRGLNIERKLLPKDSMRIYDFLSKDEYRDSRLSFIRLELPLIVPSVGYSKILRGIEEIINLVLWNVIFEYIRLYAENYGSVFMDPLESKTVTIIGVPKTISDEQLVDLGISLGAKYIIAAELDILGAKYNATRTNVITQQQHAF